MVKKLLFIFLVFSSGLVSAQDIHFTQFQMAPMDFNPAQTGSFNGSVRVGGIYRDQWSIFRTPSVFVDAPLFNLRKADWLGFGLTAIKDEAGAAKLSYTGAKLSAAYHLAFDKKRKNVLAFGVQYGFMSRSINEDKLLFEEEILNGGKTDYGKIDDAKFNEIGGGVTLTSRLSKKADMTLGIGLKHFNSPKNGQIKNSYKLPSRLVAHGQVNMDMGKKWIFSPAFIFQSISTAKELAVQGVGTYKFSKDWRFRGGLGYRIGDAAQIILGAKYKDLNVGLSYDLGLSGANQALTNVGAFEVAANYIFKIYKRPNVAPAVFCPRF